MTTWIDSNVLIVIWEGDVAAQSVAIKLLIEASLHGSLAISGCVYAEFLAGPNRPTDKVWSFLEEILVDVEWQTGEDVWRLAAERFQRYTERRRTDKNGTKRFLADFLIGAQATLRGGRLITLDRRIYAAAFPELELLGRHPSLPHP